MYLDPPFACNRYLTIEWLKSIRILSYKHKDPLWLVLVEKKKFLKDINRRSRDPDTEDIQSRTMSMPTTEAFLL